MLQVLIKEEVSSNQNRSGRERGDTFIHNKASEVCHIVIDDDNDESSPPSVRGKSPIGQSSTNLVSESES